ncbi:hypothetical protein [Scytonema sp. NUACC21]
MSLFVSREAGHIPDFFEKSWSLQPNQNQGDGALEAIHLHLSGVGIINSNLTI